MSYGSDQSGRKLGEVAINREAFELDLRINENYQAYSAELLRLALLLLSGLAFLWLRVYLPEKPAELNIPFNTRFLLACAFGCASFSAGCSLVHRYTAADSLAYQLTALRRRARNRPGAAARPSDAELAKGQEETRDRLFKACDRLLRSAVVLLFSGLILFSWALASFMF